MADIPSATGRALVDPTVDMKIKHYNIRIQENKSAIAVHIQRIKDFDTIEKPKLELLTEALQQEVEAWEKEIGKLRKGSPKDVVIDAQFKTTNGGK